MPAVSLSHVGQALGFLQVAFFVAYIVTMVTERIGVHINSSTEINMVA